MMKKIAVINDLSGLGKCSLTAAIPVISVMGVQACPFPTAVLSNQTGYETYFCEDLTRQMTPYMEQWKKRGFIPDGIYTGFLSDEKQADKILKFMDLFAGEVFNGDLVKLHGLDVQRNFLFHLFLLI